MNIILIIFDSLRKDCLEIYGTPPWGKVIAPHLNAFAHQSLVMTRAYPESLPTLPARRAIYTGRRVYPFHNSLFHLKGDFAGVPGWGPIPEDQPTLAEILRDAGYRTALISDVYHMFKPSKNFTRGFDQWTFLRGKEFDPARSGPALTQTELEAWLPREIQTESLLKVARQSLLNLRGREQEADYFAPRLFREAANWLEQNQDAERFFLVIDSFDPHEPWFVPPHYRRMYTADATSYGAFSAYGDIASWDPALIHLTRANYRASVTLCDRWFGYFMESLSHFGLLENTLIVLLSDHGHSVGDRGYLGKRGYPSMPEVFDTPLFIRLPEGRGAGMQSDIFVQHHDIPVMILSQVGVIPPNRLDGIDFLPLALASQSGPRDHVTIGWGATPTVITDRWWLNGKVDGSGMLLYDLGLSDPFDHNVAQDYPDVVHSLFEKAKEDAVGGFPAWLIEMARQQAGVLPDMVK